jgi:phosphoribosylformylglycinamidine synthase
MPQKIFYDFSFQQQEKELELEEEKLFFPKEISLQKALNRVLRLLSVGSKRFLTNKVDRSVTGLIAQQQTVGFLQIPLANCAVIAQSHFQTIPEKPFSGIVSACGEQPIKGLLNSKAMARLSVGEALTNLVWASLDGRGLKDCKCSANWMWAAKLPGEAAKMYDCCEAMTNFMKEIGIAIDGGKDSLSMAANINEKKQIKAPGTLVITMYACCDDITKTITPDLKILSSKDTKKEISSFLFYVDLGKGKNRLGGSALAQVYEQIGTISPDIEDICLFINTFKATQESIKKKLLLAGHDRSDGGLIVTLLEMAFAGNCGFEVDIPLLQTSTTTPTNTTTTTTNTTTSLQDLLQLFFSEELGLVFQVSSDCLDQVKEIFIKKYKVPLVQIGQVFPPSSTFTSTSTFTTTKEEPMVIFKVNGNLVLKEKMFDLRDIWEATSFEMEKKQCNPFCVEQEQKSLRTRSLTGPQWKILFDCLPLYRTPLEIQKIHRIGILREEGSNGEREMFSAFHMAGFEVWDITMSDLIQQRICLDEKFQGLAFVGGFSFADVLGSAKGWAGVVKYHTNVLKQFQHFKKRTDTFSLGICNGCQLMALLGWVNLNQNNNTKQQQPPRFLQNESGRFESRFVSIKIEKSNAILLKEMENSSFGVWIAHGEGKMFFENKNILQQYLDQQLAPIRYVDDYNQITEKYPFNPNGSPNGIAGLVSQDGRHLCMMPHPERCFLKWQWPYMTPEIQKLKTSPWLRMFQNAKIFCEQQNL